MHASFVISSGAHYNPQISVFVVYLLKQEIFVNKILFFKFLSMSDKPWLDQLKITTATRGVVVQASLDLSIVTRKGKYTVVTTIMKPQQLIKHIKISYFLASLVFCKYSCFTYWNGLNQGTSKLRHSKYLKKYKPCYFYTFCQEYTLQYTFAQSVVPQKFICVPKIIDFQFQCTMTDCEFKIWH